MSKRTSSDCCGHNVNIATKKRKIGEQSSTLDLLPDPISRKKFRADVKKAFSLLKEINVFSSSKSTKVTMDQVLCILINKFGWSAISTIASVVNSLPEVLTETQFSAFLERKCTERGVDLSGQSANMHEIAELLQNECRQFVSSFEKELLVLAPPLAECPTCSTRLVVYHDCTTRVYEMDGVITLPKITLRCIGCKLYFGYSQFGNKKPLGFRYYENERPYIEVTDTVFVNRKLLEFQCSLAYVLNYCESIAC